MLRPGGRLVVTTPNRLTFPPGNPFHSRELDATELTGSSAATSTVDGRAGAAPRAAAGRRRTARLGGLVAAQVLPTPDRRDDDLRAPVAAVTADDFVVGPRPTAASTSSSTAVRR